MTWRESARKHIEKVVLRVGTEDKGRLKRELFDAYPWCERKHYPYKVWCEEVRKVLNPNWNIKPLPKNNLFGIKERTEQR